MIKATKNNGKGKRPSDVAVTFEGRNAYGTRHISVLCSNRDGSGTYNLLNIDIADMKELVKALDVAFQAAEKAADTTPEKYKAQQAASVAPAANVDIAAMIQAAVAQALAGIAPQAPQTATQASSAVDDLQTLANSVQRTTSKPKTKKK